MRKLILLPFLCLIFLPARAQDTILLFHPTAYNLELFQKLHREALLNLEGWHLLGVFHKGETYDYGEARVFLSEHPDYNASLLEFGVPLAEDSLFMNNVWSPGFRRLFSISKGAFFMGGPDIPPSIYGERTHLLTRVSDPWRHYLELSYAFHLLGGLQNQDWNAWLNEDPDYLVSGICLGLQGLNVSTGGTLIQDIPTELDGIWTAEELLELPGDRMHRNYADMIRGTCASPSSYHFHRIRLEKGGFLTRDIRYSRKGTPLVLSSHHQAIEETGKGWKAAATSMDGRIIEAIEHTEYPYVFGVQFHPEKPGLFDPSLLDPTTCGDSISFREVIRETDAWEFHQKYWHHISAILQKIGK